MAVDFMVQQVRFRNKCIATLFAWLLLMACNPVQEQKQVSSTPSSRGLLKSRDSTLKIVNGIVMRQDSVFSGILFDLYPGTNDTASIAQYLNGKEHGEWRKYHPSKKIKERRFFEAGKKTGNYYSWWENGRLQLHYVFKADEYEGTCREWNATGLLTKQMHYRDGHEEGLQQWWYDNGKIKANYVIKEGRRYGLLGTKNCINVTDSIFR